MDDHGKARRLRIFLVEDDQLLRDTVSSRLGNNSYAVVEAPSGDEAFSMLCSGEKVDLLITDISMPGSVDGWALAKQVRLMDPEVMVIYTSSRPHDAERQVSHSLYIRKPYHPDLLIAAIQQLVASIEP